MRATFLASFPAIQSAIKVYGDRQGMRIQLDIPESEMGQAAQLLLMREKIFRITVDTELTNELEDIESEPAPTVSRRAAKKRV